MAVTISPNPVAPGQSFTVGFTGYVPNSTIFAFFVTGSQSEPIPIATSNNGVPIQMNAQGGGSWSATILPSAPERNYTLHVVNSTGNETLHTIQVQAIVNYTRITRFVNNDVQDLTNGSVITVGEQINAILLDYPPNKAVDVLIQSEVIASNTTAFNGNAGFTFTIDRPGTFDLRVNEHGDGTDYGQISVVVQSGSTPTPTPIPGDIDPLWLVAGVAVLGVGAFALTGGFKKFGKK